MLHYHFSLRHTGDFYCHIDNMGTEKMTSTLDHLRHFVTPNLQYIVIFKRTLHRRTHKRIVPLSILQDKTWEAGFQNMESDGILSNWRTSREKETYDADLFGLSYKGHF